MMGKSASAAATTTCTSACCACNGGAAVASPTWTSSSLLLVTAGSVLGSLVTLGATYCTYYYYNHHHSDANNNNNRRNGDSHSDRVLEQSSSKCNTTSNGDLSAAPPSSSSSPHCDMSKNCKSNGAPAEKVALNGISSCDCEQDRYHKDNLQEQRHVGLAYRRGRRNRLPKAILLVRHGESEANADQSKWSELPDNLLGLSERGRIQAAATGRRVATLLEQLECQTTHLVVSPFERTLQTAVAMRPAFEDAIVRTDIESRIREQEMGNLQGDDFGEFRRQQERVGRFWYRFPTGESGADVLDRVKSWWFESVLTVNEREGYDPVDAMVVVTHGLTMRFILMQLFGWSPTTFHSVWNANNCDVYALRLDVSKPGPSPYVLDTQLGDVPRSSIDVLITLRSTGERRTLKLEHYLGIPPPRTTRLGLVKKMLAKQHSGLRAQDIDSIMFMPFVVTGQSKFDETQNRTNDLKPVMDAFESPLALSTSSNQASNRSPLIKGRSTANRAQAIPTLEYANSIDSFTSSTSFSDRAGLIMDGSNNDEASGAGSRGNWARNGSMSFLERFSSTHSQPEETDGDCLAMLRYLTPDMTDDEESDDYDDCPVNSKNQDCVLGEEDRQVGPELRRRRFAKERHVHQISRRISGNFRSMDDAGDGIGSCISKSPNPRPSLLWADLVWQTASTSRGMSNRLSNPAIPTT